MSCFSSISVGCLVQKQSCHNKSREAHGQKNLNPGRQQWQAKGKTGRQVHSGGACLHGDKHGGMIFGSSCDAGPYKVYPTTLIPV